MLFNNIGLRKKRGGDESCDRVKMGKEEDIEEIEINAYYWNGGVPHRMFQGKFSFSMTYFMSLGYS